MYDTIPPNLPDTLPDDHVMTDDEQSGNGDPDDNDDISFIGETTTEEMVDPGTIINVVDEQDEEGTSDEIQQAGLDGDANNYGNTMDDGN